jgi:hypothetical protein
VSKLLVFNPDLEWPLGAVEDQGPGSGIFQRGTQKNGERGKPGPAAQGADAGPAFGAAPDAGAFGKGDSDTGGRRPKSASAGPGGKAAAAPQSLEVRGQITSLKGGKMSLRVPNAPFKGPLKIDIAENADIDLDLSNPDAVTLAQKGDKVRAHGQQFSERMGQARELEITLSQPAAARNTKKKKG